MAKQDRDRANYIMLQIALALNGVQTMGKAAEVSRIPLETTMQLANNLSNITDLIIAREPEAKEVINNAKA